MITMEEVRVDDSQVLAMLGAVALPELLRHTVANPYNRYRNATADNPADMPAGPELDKYAKAMEQRIQEFEPGYNVEKQLAVMTPEVARQSLPGMSEHASKASNTRLNEGNRKRLGYDNVIAINPYHDRAALAHEMGHTVTQRTKLGNLIHKAKTAQRIPGEGVTLENLPKILKSVEGKSLSDKARAVLSAPGGARKATLLATALVPGMASVLTPGSDDTAQALALAYAINAPTLLDEAFATGEGLGIMKRAGTPATIGQRGRLAGAYMTYLLAPTVAALSANAAGNFFDENV